MGAGRVVGVDLGARRIGVAISNSDRTVALPHAVIERTGDPASEHEAILSLAREHDADTVVVGLPLTLEGEIGTAARQVLSEVDELRRRAGPAYAIEVHDERFTTTTAEAGLVARGLRRRRRRQIVDQMAASLILQSWLDASSKEQL